MARTCQENSDWWQRQATRYDGEAEAAKTPQARQKWTDWAILARAAATKCFLSPAPSGVQAAANPL